MHVRNFADWPRLPRLYDFARLEKQRARALLQADRRNAFRISGGLDQQLAFTNGVADGFFEIQILARLQSLNRRNRMPMIWRSDDDGIYVFAVKDAAKIGYGVNTFAAFAQPFAGFGETRLIYVTNGDGLRIGQLETIAHIADSLTAASDQGETNRIVCA